MTMQDYQLQFLGTELLEPGRHSRRINPESVERLAENMAQHSVICPLVVRPLTGGRFQIVTGRRRWQAAQMAGIDRVPCIVRTLDEAGAAAMALSENSHRENLRPIERAHAARQLRDQHGYTLSELAVILYEPDEGRAASRQATVSHLIRLLALPEDVQRRIDDGQLTIGHGKALLTLQGQPRAKEFVSSAAKQAAWQGWSVRLTEEFARFAGKRPQESFAGVLSSFLDARSGDASVSRDRDIVRFEDALRTGLKAPVNLSQEKGAWVLTVQYYSIEELRGIQARLLGVAESSLTPGPDVACPGAALTFCFPTLEALNQATGHLLAQF